MRLGFVVKPLAQPALKSHDARRWQNNPHLSISLAFLRDILRYLVETAINMYRLSSDLAPYATHPDMPQFHSQIEDCASELAQVGDVARRAGIRLSFHAAQYVVINSPDSGASAHASATLSAQALILESMRQGPDAVVVTHIGGIYGNREAARERFLRAIEALPEITRRRLALENDDARFAVSDIDWIHQRSGVRLVFDTLHHRLNNPDHLPERTALATCLATWPAGVRPKIHFSTPRTEWLVLQTSVVATPTVRRSRWSYHSDYVNPFEFIDFVRGTQGLPDFDVMLEARAKDLALLQLRDDLLRYAPDLAARLEPPPPTTAISGDDC